MTRRTAEGGAAGQTRWRWERRGGSVGGPRGGAVCTLLGVGATEHFPGRWQSGRDSANQGPKAGVGRPRSFELTGQPLLFHLPSPLQSRECASSARGTRHWRARLDADFEALIDPIYAFLNETHDRSPMTDWYETKDAKKVGFTARPVVGGVFLQLLYDKAVWKKWASRDKTKAANWATIPLMPKITAIVPAADRQPAIWRYTMAGPAEDWMKSGFEDSSWKEGKSGFGTEGTPGAIIGTVWNTPDIWLRREVEIPADKSKNLELWIHHDEDAEIYINGVAAAHPKGYVSDYFNRPPNAAGIAALKPGKNLIAVHCHQTGGGQYSDVGFVEVEAAK